MIGKRIDKQYPKGVDDPLFLKLVQEKIDQQVDESEARLRSQANQIAKGCIEQISQNDLTPAVREHVNYLGQEQARLRWQSYQSEEWRMSLLYFSIGAFIFWADPLKVGIGISAGCLLSAWEPLVDEAAYRGGTLVHAVLRTMTGRADEIGQSELDEAVLAKGQGLFTTWLVLGYPAVYFLSALPIVGNYIWFMTAPLTSAYAVTCAAIVGNRFFRHINSVHEEYHPQEADGQERTPLLFRVEEMRELWEQSVIPAWNRAMNGIRNGANWVANRAPGFVREIGQYVLLIGQWGADPWRSLDRWLIDQAGHGNRPAAAYAEVRDWFSTKAGLLRQGAYTSHMLAVGLFGAWMCMSDSPYLFTVTAVITAYFAATTKSADLSLNPITRWLSPLTSSPTLLLGLGILYIGAKIVAFGFATGLAVSTYWRGPYSFPVYQVLGLAFTNTWIEDIFAVTAGIAAGGQLWQQSRRLYEERDKDLPDNLIELIGARVAQLGRWATTFVGEGVLIPLADMGRRLLAPWLNLAPQNGQGL